MADGSLDAALRTPSLPMSSRERTARRKKDRPSFRWETRLRRQGWRSIAGIDEVGRGSLFGPVVAAAVILDPERPIRGLRDSKQLAPRSREALSGRIRERSRAFAFGAVDSAGVDRWNVLQAARRAMTTAVQSLGEAVDYLLIDALRLDLDTPQESLVRGDARCASIAAASILAKTERDRWMRAWDKVYPQYRLASNKGYATRDHLRALEEHGPTPLHRFSFRPVRETARLPLLAADAQRPETLPLFPEGEFT